MIELLGYSLGEMTESMSIGEIRTLQNEINAFMSNLVNERFMEDLEWGLEPSLCSHIVSGESECKSNRVKLLSVNPFWCFWKLVTLVCLNSYADVQS